MEFYRHCGADIIHDERDVMVIMDRANIHRPIRRLIKAESIIHVTGAKNMQFHLLQLAS